jgi:polyisoprenoid-binding protein YceI
VEVTIDAASVRTNHEMRDNDLRSENFFDVATFPTITFTSTRVETVGPDRYTMTGDLTIKGTA